MYKRERDTQRKRVYAAERVLDDYGRIENVSEIQVYVNKIWASKWARKHFRMACACFSPLVADGRGTRIARGGWQRLNLPRWARTKTVILHELTHALLPDEGASHGWQFAKAYLDIVRHVLGREAAAKLKAAYRQYHVRFRPKRRLSSAAIERRWQLLSFPSVPSCQLAQPGSRSTSRRAPTWASGPRHGSGNLW